MNSLYGPRAVIEKISYGVPLADVIVLATLWVSSALVMTGLLFEMGEGLSKSDGVEAWFNRVIDFWRHGLTVVIYVFFHCFWFPQKTWDE